MRAIGLSDLDAATRAVLVVPAEGRPAFAADLIEAAHLADLWRKRTGGAHANGGTGSLAAQAACHPRAARSVACPEYCASLSILLTALEHWRGRLDQTL